MDTTLIARADMRDHVSDEEWKVRCDLAALYRLVAHYRMTDLIFTHISAKLPGDDETFLINPYGMLFSEIRASDLIRIDIDGNVVDGRFESPYGVNRAGFVIHSAIHRARHDVMCVLHTHTAAGVAVSAQKGGLMPISQHALKFYECLGYHRYEGIALDLEEQDRLVADLGSHRAMILENHGLLVCGRTLAEAFDHIVYLERACQIQIAACSKGADHILIPDPDVCRRTAAQFQMDSPTVRPYVALAWQAALRDAQIDASNVYC
ncbi:class II aldolase/adducin family protein [Paraburkholderia tropica]|uniref:class II aldolase/adducin family protein n=1 Tax=Paraburkholderia tropica TaxID=92647 RepID=UPI002AB6D268|nr:class II aldolase/adducin family protein [Paraburkholderia tropica]